jgi:hypothetical protein
MLMDGERVLEKRIPVAAPGRRVKPAFPELLTGNANRRYPGPDSHSAGLATDTRKAVTVSDARMGDLPSENR